MSRQFNNEPFSTVNDLTNSDNCESHIFLLVSYEHIGSLKESVSSNYTPPQSEIITVNHTVGKNPMKNGTTALCLSILKQIIAH